MTNAEAYTADTIAILGYLAETLPPKANAIFRRVEEEKAKLIVPTIVIGESLFTLLKGRHVFGVEVPLEKLTLLLDTLESTPGIVLADLDIQGWRILMKIDLPELHDRMIAATHMRMNARAILTNDEEIGSLSGIKPIWS